MRFDIAAFLTLTVTHFTELPSNSWLCLWVCMMLSTCENLGLRRALWWGVSFHILFFSARVKPSLLSTVMSGSEKASQMIVKRNAFHEWEEQLWWFRPQVMIQCLLKKKKIHQIWALWGCHWNEALSALVSDGSSSLKSWGRLDLFEELPVLAALSFWYALWWTCQMPCLMLIMDHFYIMFFIYFVQSMLIVKCRVGGWV